jgi:hypothetical protein
MGFLSGLLLFPIAGPVMGIRLFAERLRDEAESVLYDEGRNHAELIELSMRRNAGKITDAEYAEQEARLLERLTAIREYQEELRDAEYEMLEGGSYDDELDEDAFADTVEVESETAEAAC